MTGPEIDEKVEQQKPLLPKTAASATIVAVPVMAILSALGYVGQRVIELDETVVKVEQTQESRDAWVTSATEDLGMLKEELRTLSDQAAAQAKDQSEIRTLGARIDERLVKVETLVDVIQKEQQGRKRYFQKESSLKGAVHHVGQE